MNRFARRGLLAAWMTIWRCLSIDVSREYTSRWSFPWQLGPATGSSYWKSLLNTPTPCWRSSWQDFSRPLCFIPRTIEFPFLPSSAFSSNYWRTKPSNSRCNPPHTATRAYRKTRLTDGSRYVVTAKYLVPGWMMTFASRLK